MTPWFCDLNLNEILWSHEKQGGTALSPNRQRFLQYFMDTVNFMDLGFCRSKYTWGAMRRSNEVVQERLDKGLVNDAW